MTITRRDFMKLFGVSLASVLLTRCRPFAPFATCYAPMPPPTVSPPPTGSSARERLRLAWLSFDELARRTVDTTSDDNSFGQQLAGDHRRALDELVAAGELSAPVANLVQEAYDAALYHVWRSNAPITCYEPAMVDYAPTSAQVLVTQSEVLQQIAAQGAIDPDTLAKAQSALEHDLAFYALTDEEIQALYAQLLEGNYTGQPMPTFETLPLEVTPEARAAAQFILDLLSRP